jgi:hypothetical protein
MYEIKKYEGIKNYGKNKNDDLKFVIWNKYLKLDSKKYIFFGK